MPPPGLSNGHNKLASHPGLTGTTGLGASGGFSGLMAPLILDETLTVDLPVPVDHKIGQVQNRGDAADRFSVVSIDPPVAREYFSLDDAGVFRVTRLGILHLRRRQYILKVEAVNVIGSGRAVITIRVV
jgi:hypothetical protein